MRWVWSCVASAMTTGTPRARAWPRKRLSSSALDDHDALTLGDQALHDRDADGPQPMTTTWSGHAVDLPPAEGALNPPADQNVGEEGEGGGHQGHAERR